MANADSYTEFSFYGTCPVVQSETVVLPSVTLPLTVETPATLRALESSLKADGIIFLTDSGRKIGTLCRASRKLMSSTGGEDCAEWGFIVEGLERGTALSSEEVDGLLWAEVLSDPELDSVPNEEQLKWLDTEVRKLLCELHPLLPDIENSIHPLFNVQDISSPSRLADRTAFLLSMCGLISQERQRVILKTFPPDLRLESLVEILTVELETIQLRELLLKRLERRYATRPLLPRQFLDQFERKAIHYFEEFLAQLNGTQSSAVRINISFAGGR